MARATYASRVVGWVAAIAAASLLTLIAPATASAKAGDLIPGYGIGGIKASHDDEPGQASGRDSTQSQMPIGLQPSGKPILAGRVTTYGCSTGNCIYSAPYVVERLDRDGDLDPSFGAGGITSIYDLGQPIVVDQSILQPDGKILIVGADKPYDSDTLVVIRLDADGALDSSFAGDGVAQIPTPGGSYVGGTHVAVLPDGHVAAGIDIEDRATAQSVVSIAELDAFGSPDPSFGSGGYVTEPEGRYGHFEAMLADSQGRLLVVDARKDAAASFENDPVVTRYQPNGSLDQSYGVFGEARLPVETASDSYDVVTSSDAVLRLSRSDSNGRARVTSITSDGMLDQGFGANGSVKLDPGITTAQGRPQTPRIDALAVQGDGRILVSGGQRFLGGSLLTLGRLLEDGSVDQSFGDAGYSTVYATPRIDRAGVLAMPGEQILLAGGSPGAKIVSAEYRGAAGAIDDRDGDRVRDGKDVCPQRFATSADGCPHHRSKLTLDFTRRGKVAFGTLRSSYPRCIYRVTVGIFVKTAGRDRRIGHRLIYRRNIDGGQASYSIRIPRSPSGRRYAAVKRSFNPAIGICRGVRSAPPKVG